MDAPVDTALDLYERCVDRARRALATLRPPRFAPPDEAMIQALAAATVPDRPVPAPQDVPLLIDHTLLRLDATPAEIEAVCAEAARYGFKAVCINPRYVPRAVEALVGTGVHVCTVVGFPLGASATAVKVLEAQLAIEQGAQELDMVLAVGDLKAGLFEDVRRDVAAVAVAAHAGQVLLKVIVEAGLLTATEQVRACLLVRDAGADFVKTATGFVGRGATEEDVRRLRAAVGPAMGVKAAGGIRTRADLERMMRAGATRIGTSSAVAIMREYAT
ncbi:MAG TPA: deoxyribose-phosphate aldolase [bacterium]|nr:deoxyribose-phosphate aldolase [bacterium]